MVHKNRRVLEVHVVPQVRNAYSMGLEHMDNKAHILVIHRDKEESMVHKVHRVHKAHKVHKAHTVHKVHTVRKAHMALEYMDPMALSSRMARNLKRRRACKVHMGYMVRTGHTDHMAHSVAHTRDIDWLKNMVKHHKDHMEHMALWGTADMRH